MRSVTLRCPLGHIVGRFSSGTLTSIKKQRRIEIEGNATVKITCESCGAVMKWVVDGEKIEQILSAEKKDEKIEN